MHERLGSVLSLLALTATGCPAPAPPPVAAPAPVVAPVEPVTSSVIPELGYVVTTPTFVSAQARVRVQPLARSALSVAWADRGTYLVLRGWGGVVKTPRLRRGVSLPRRHFVRAAFSPSRRYLALTDQRKRLLVVTLPRGKVIHDVARAERPKWISDDVVAFRRGCSGVTLRVGAPSAKPRTIGSIPAPCVSIIDVSSDYTVWTIADRGELRRGRWLVHTGLRVANLRTGAITSVRTTPFMAPRIAPSGDRHCWLEENFDLYCQSGQVPEKIWSNVRRPIQFDDTGRRLLFAVGNKSDPSSRVFVVDFQDRSIAQMPRAGREWWVFLAGGTRIAGHGGRSSGLIYDLAAGWSAEVGDPESEWEGMWALPGDPNRLAVGRERRGSRDLFHATITP